MKTRPRLVSPRLDSTTQTIVTSVQMPVPLWQDVKIRAVHEHTDLRTICERALRAYLATPLPGSE